MSTPNWDYDLAFGAEGEATAKAWHRGGHETKAKRRLDDGFYLEYEQNPFDQGWRPSGVMVTDAPYYEWVIAETGIVLAVPTPVLRHCVTHELGYPVEETDGTCPTRGRLLRLSDMLTAWKAWDSDS